MFEAYSRYFEFSGRSTRREFFLFVLTNVLMLFGAVIVDFAAFDGEARLASNPISGPCYLFVLIVNAIPGLSVSIRRLHDVGKSGWFLLLGAVPLANLYLLYLYFKRSDPQANAYGPPKPAGVARVLPAAPVAPPAPSQSAPPPLPRASTAPAAGPAATPPPLPPRTSGGPPPAAAQPAKPQVSPAGAQPVDTMLERLQQLGRLRDQGILGEEEFAAQKARILNGDG